MSDMVDNITDWALNEYIRIYEDDTITKEDIFYYTYGILHSPGYRKKYQAFLVRGLPNIPHAPDFRAYEKAGRQLADLHLNFETCPRYDLGEPVNPIPQAPKKIQFGKKPNDGPGPKMIPDHSVLILDGILVYNNLPHIRYKVNGRTPIQWFHAYYCYRVAKKSGNTNYPLKYVSSEGVRAIIERLTYVGMESDKIVDNLPEEFEMQIAKKVDPKKQPTIEAYFKHHHAQ